MQIIHIIPGKANPNTLNGVNKVVDAIATEQTCLGYDTMVVGVANNIEKRHEPLYNYKLFTKSRNPFLYPRGILDFLLGNSTEDTVLHFHSVFVFWFLPLIKALKENGRKHIFLTPHGQYIDEAMRPLKKRVIFKLIDAKILREVEAVHIIGCKTEDNHYIRDNANRIVIIPNGFGCQNVPFYNKGEELTFGYLGRLECKQKGLDILLPAFINYRKSGGKGILHLAGSGPDEMTLKKMVKDACMENAILFDGVLYDEQKWKFLYNCSFFVHPSRWDGMPTACLEAASIGCPLLVTDMTNMGDILEIYKAGESIRALDIPSLQEQLEKFEQYYNDLETYNTLCRNSKRMIDEELNWSNITKKIINSLYQL